VVVVVTVVVVVVSVVVVVVAVVVVLVAVIVVAVVVVCVVVVVVHGQHHGSTSCPGSRLTFWYATYWSCHFCAVWIVPASAKTFLRVHMPCVPCQWKDMHVLAESQSAAHASTDDAVSTKFVSRLGRTVPPLIKPVCSE